MSFDGAKVGAAIVVMVREYIAHQLDGLGDQFKALGGRIEALEKRAPIPGPVGDKGDPGEKGDPGTDGRSLTDEDVRPMMELMCAGYGVQLAQAIANIPTPKDGADGRDGVDGKSVSVEELQIPIREAVSEVVTRVEADLITRTDAYLAGLPKPQDGRDGVDGKSITLEDVTPFIHDEIRKSVAELPPPEKGDKGDSGERGPAGKDGESVDPDVVQRMVDDAVAAAVASIPRPKDGEKGDRGSDGLDGKDAEPVSLDAVKSMLAELVQKAVAEIPVPQNGLNGQDGRDAPQLEVLPAVDPKKSYPRNTYAIHAGGLIRAFRETDAINLAEIEKSGWETVLNGVAEESEKMLEDGRTIVRSTVYTNGQKFERTFTTTAIQYRHVYKADTVYFKGDIVTWGGETWHCNVDGATDEPKYKHGGTSSWSLMVKKGRDGKDSK